LSDGTLGDKGESMDGLVAMGVAGSCLSDTGKSRKSAWDQSWVPAGGMTCWKSQGWSRVIASLQAMHT
jgi:hypothetical protein